MSGFEIWHDHQCIHSDMDYEVEYTQDLYDDVLGWWNGFVESESYDNEAASEYLVKIFVGDDNGDGDEEELTIAELLA